MEGYTTIGHATYDEWRTNTMGHSYDVDGYYGAQCWDYAAELWYNVGFGTGWPHTGPNGVAYECWTNSRYQNAGTKFDLVELLAVVKRGDVVVLDQGRFAGDTTGHIAFADEDYDGSGQMWLVGQNQTNPSAYGSPVARTRMSVLKFLGAFRLKEWATPPEPEKKKKHKFPWYIYRDKLGRIRGGV